MTLPAHWYFPDSFGACTLVQPLIIKKAMNFERSPADEGADEDGATDDAIHYVGGEPAVLVMRDGAVATLYSAQDGSTVLEAPDGSTTTVLTSPDRSSSLSSRGSSFASFKGNKTTNISVLTATGDDCSAVSHYPPPNSVISERGAPPTSTRECPSKPGLPAIMLNGRNIRQHHFSPKTPRITSTQSGHVFSALSSSSPSLRSVEGNGVVTTACTSRGGSDLRDCGFSVNNGVGVGRTYGNRTYGKRHLMKQPLLSAAISNNVVKASKTSPTLVVGSNKSVFSVSDPKSNNSRASTTLEATQVADNVDTDYLAPRLTLSVIPQSDRNTVAPQTQRLNTLVLSTGDDKSLNSIDRTRVCHTQIVSSGIDNNIQTLLATLPSSFRVSDSISGARTTLKTTPLSTTHGAVLQRLSTSEGSRLSRLQNSLSTSQQQSTALFIQHPRSQNFQNIIQSPDAKSSVICTSVGGSGQCGEATVTTAVYESATAFVDTNTGTATVVEGAEVVRSTAVSYATPILHQVFLQATGGLVTTAEGGGATVFLQATPAEVITSSSSVACRTIAGGFPGGGVMSLGPSSLGSVLQEDGESDGPCQTTTVINPRSILSFTLPNSTSSSSVTMPYSAITLPQASLGTGHSNTLQFIEPRPTLRDLTSSSSPSTSVALTGVGPKSASGLLLRSQHLSKGSCSTVLGRGSLSGSETIHTVTSSGGLHEGTSFTTSRHDSSSSFSSFSSARVSSSSQSSEQFSQIREPSSGVCNYTVATQLPTTSSQAPPSAHPSSAFVARTTSPVAMAPSTPRNDDELTSLSWLQNSNLLKSTALSPIKLPSNGQQTPLRASSPGELKDSSSFDEGQRVAKMPVSRNGISSLSPGANGLFGGGVATHSGGKHVMVGASHGAGRLAGLGSASHTGRQVNVSAPTGGKWQHGVGASQGSSARQQQHTTGNGFGVKEEAADVKVESPTSDYGEESGDASEAGDLCLNAEQQTQMSGSGKSHHTAPQNGGQLATSKPPYSFSCLIFMAIEDSEEKALPVKSIYAWVVHHFPYFRTAPTGWKNSVRHNLSLNKCFRKVDKSPNLGKGSLWMVDPAHRPTLLQSLSKVPFHSCGDLDKVYMLSTRHGGSKNSVSSSGAGHQHQQQQRTSVSQLNAMNSLKDQTYHQPIKHAQLLNEANGGDWSRPGQSDQLPHSAANCPSSQASNYPSQQHVVSSQYSSVVNCPSSSSSLVGGTSSSAISFKQEQLQEDSLQISSTVSVSSSNTSVIDSIPNGGGNAPDPALFPYLARRLGGGAVAVLPDVGVLEGVGLEDVDAANAMLVLKHGPQRLVHQILGGVSAATTDHGSVSVTEASGPDPKRRRHQMMENSLMVMSTSPSHDHDHAHTNQPDTETDYHPNTSGSSSYCRTSTPCSSPCSSSFSSPSTSMPPTPPLLPPSQRVRARGRALAAALVRAQQQSSSPTSSIDEAFSDGSFESDAGEADFQQMVDGADALLNFAARATTMMPALLNGHITTYPSARSEFCGQDVESFNPAFQNASTSLQSSVIDRGYKVHDAHNSHFGSRNFVHVDDNDAGKDGTIHGDDSVSHVPSHLGRQEFSNGGGLPQLNEGRQWLTADNYDGNTVCGGTATSRRNIVTYPAARSGLTGSTLRAAVIHLPACPEGLGLNDQCLDRDDIGPLAKRIMLEPSCGFEEASDLANKTVSSVSQNTASKKSSVVTVSKSGFRAPLYSREVLLATSKDSFKYSASKSSGTLQRTGGVDKGAKSIVENHSRISLNASKAKSMLSRTPGNMKHNNNNSLTSNNNISSLTKKIKRTRAGNPKLGLR